MYLFWMDYTCIPHIHELIEVTYLDLVLNKC